MYTFTNTLKIGSFIAMAVGFMLLAIGFISAPSTVEEAKAYEAAHGDGHGHGGHGEATDHGGQGGGHAIAYQEEKDTHGTKDDHHAEESQHHEAKANMHHNTAEDGDTAHSDASGHHGEDHGAAHYEHLLHQLQNRPWAALYVAAFFFFMISLGVLAFYAIQRAAQAGWSPILFRVMEGITAYLVPGGIIVFVILTLSVLHMNHMFVWMDEDVVTESMMSWDWIMSLDPHWFSTLFGWYVFASMFVSGITTIAIITIYLKSKGYLTEVNDSHIHDLAKFMFGISIFWTYLWFAQFMLIWYANIPEEVTYYVARFQDYKIPFFGMLVLNFIFPLLVLMNSDYKRLNWFVIMTGVIVLFGHYLDIFNMVMPATVGDQWGLGIPEIGGILFFGGLFTFWVFTALAKAPLQPKRNPFLEESRQFHY
nr:quinol:cytochrome C oxidoreductase [uncultured Allomuricauda sp.]